MRLSALILKIAGWKVEVETPDFDKCIICVAPHTSNWDFILGILAYYSVGRRAGFLMKDSWFVFPLGYFFRALGGIPVPRKKKGRSVVDTVVERFAESSHLHIAITPEGTRSRTAKWHTGFLTISRLACVPCILGVLDFGEKRIMLKKVFYPSDDPEKDIKYIKNFYKSYKGKYPEKFTAEDE